MQSTLQAGELTIRFLGGLLESRRVVQIEDAHFDLVLAELVGNGFITNSNSDVEISAVCSAQ